MVIYILYRCGFIIYILEKMQALTNKTASKLRGGGCGCFRIVPDT